MGNDHIVLWLVPGRVLYAPGTTDKEVMGERNRLSLMMIDETGQQPMVHTLIDHRNRYSPEELANQPKSILAYGNFGDEEIRERLITHPLLGWVISIATPNLGLKMAGKTQSRHYRWHTVDTWQEAVTFLLARDSSIKDIPSVEIE